MSTSSRESRQQTLAALAARAPRSYRPGGLIALWTLFVLSLRQFLRGKRALVLLVLSLLPVGLALLVRNLDVGPRGHGPELHRIEAVVLFNLTPYATLPLAALLYGSGLIVDEQEEQTLTYLLIRPIPKWGVYLAKLLAALCVVSVLVAAFVIEIDLAVYAFTSEWPEVFPKKMLITIAVMILSAATYTCLFGAASLFVKRTLIFGIIYIGVVEGILSNLPFALRQLTVMYYFRVLSLSWIPLDDRLQAEWSIKLADADAPLTCVLVLLIAAALSTVLAMTVFSQREFHVKTPETV